MIPTDPLDLLRASDPVPYGSSAPPIERVLERIRAETPGRRRWRDRTSALIPAMGAAAAIGVAAVALLLVGVHHQSAAHRSVPAVRSSVPVVPAGGMRGLVFIYGAVFPSASGGLISLEQCLGYHNGDPTAHTSCRDWMASTVDGGASWGVTRRPWNVFDPTFSGKDGWAEGSQALPHGSSAPRFYATHDGGRSWSVAASAAFALGDQHVSVGGGEVWAVGSDCSGAAQCAVTIMHGPVTGGRLAATAAQPVAGSWTNVEVVAAGPRTAYVLNPDHAQQTFVTHDDGRSWQQIQSACPASAFLFSRLASSGSPGSVWVTCQPRHGATTLRRSVDGGRSWQVLPGHFANVFRLEPVSAQAAWGVTPNGAVLRTTDGGSTWSTVWSPGRSQPASLTSRPSSLVAQASGTPMLAVQSATSASIVMILTSGHVDKQARFTNLVVYRTNDGGATWNVSLVPLPGR